MLNKVVAESGFAPVLRAQFHCLCQTYQMCVLRLGIALSHPMNLDKTAVPAPRRYFWVKTKREEKAGRFSREDTDQIDKMFARDTYSSTANVEQE